MRELQRRAGEEEDLAEDLSEPENIDYQARIDAVRRMQETGTLARRDGEGQSLDHERPWSRR